MAEVFVIENDLQHSRRIQQVALRTGDYRLESFVDSAQAVEELQKRIDRRGGIPELLILDLNLPGDGGHEMLRYCWQSGVSRLSSILVIARNQSEIERRESFLLGAQAYLDKDASDEDLERAIRDLLDDNEFEESA